MIKSINAEELKAKLDAGEEIILIDCREKDEWDSGRIEKAVFMPLSKIQEESKKLENKDATIIVQCRSGKRSLTSCEFLESEGYSNLTNLEGGILGWMDEGFDITR